MATNVSISFFDQKEELQWNQGYFPEFLLQITMSHFCEKIREMAVFLLNLAISRNFYSKFQCLIFEKKGKGLEKFGKLVF